MGKSYQRCPTCCKKGLYTSFGYPKEVDMRCRYCGYFTLKKKSVAKWEAVESEGRWRVREIEEDGNPITVVREVRNGVTARLIADAPDLLAALEAMCGAYVHQVFLSLNIGYQSGMTVDDCRKAYEEANALIARAKGGE